MMKDTKDEKQKLTRGRDEKSSKEGKKNEKQS